MKAYRGVEVELHTFLTSVIDEGGRGLLYARVAVPWAK
jgi:hypothetical protein